MKTRLALLVVALVGLLTAACTRSATTANLPTETPAGQGGGAQPGSDPTMDALGTQLAATQAAQQAGGGLEGAAGETPAAPEAATATPTQVAGQAATATPIPQAATATPVPTTVAAACANPYTVKQGDWIYKIARECKLDPRAIIAANPNINPNRLSPGQVITLPGGATAVPPTAAPGATATSAPQACKGTYTVKAGDNLFRIAYNCGFTTEQLARANNIPAPYRIFPGQVIKYP